jgi:hypothetical protein
MLVSLACGNQEKGAGTEGSAALHGLTVLEDSAALELRGKGKKHIECGVRIIKRREGKTRKRE